MVQFCGLKTENPFKSLYDLQQGGSLNGSNTCSAALSQLTFFFCFYALVLHLNMGKGSGDMILEGDVRRIVN